jgi:predicted aspartyl protease
LYAEEELATVTVVTGFCGYLVLDHQLRFFITEVSERHHVTRFVADANKVMGRVWCAVIQVDAIPMSSSALPLCSVAQ